MNKITQLLTIALFTSSIWGAISPSSLAQDTLTQDKTPQPSTSTTETKPKTKTTSVLEALLGLLKSSESRLITRGEKVCLISPGTLGESLVYSDRPIFVWARLQPETPESQFKLYSVSANFNYEQDAQLLLNEQLPANSHKIAYQEQPLQPEYSYDWEIIFPDKTYTKNFAVMDREARVAISSDLASLEAQLSAKNSNSEAIAIAKADYFAQKQLWSDVFQQLYSVSDPSRDLLAKRQEAEDYLCGSFQSNTKIRRVSVLV